MTAQARYPDLARLLGVLDAAGFEVDATDVADACWLARILPAPPAAVPQDAASPSPAPPPPLEPPPPPSPEADREVREPGAGGPTQDDLYPSTRGVSGGRSLVLLPDAPALLDKLALGRALRPLRRRIASSRQLLVDELATVKRTAARRLAWPGAPLVPAFRPGRARWLDAVLLVDRSQTMAVWRRSVEEWTVLLQRLGAFRDVRVWYLTAGHGGPTLEVPGDHPSQWVARDVAELIDPSGRRLVMIASDCIDALWATPALTRWLARLARVGPLAILQILPPHLWQRTALARLPAVTLTAPAPGLPTHRLAAAALDPDGPDDFDGELDDRSAPAIPVVPMRSDALAAWAHLLIGAASGRATGYRFAELPAAPPHPRPTEDASALVRRFLAGSSAVARRLAAYLAAVPLTAPVIRLVRQEVLPEAREEHLVEVLFSGLVVQCVPDLWTVAPGDELYDFRPGVREHLLSGLDTATIEGVARAIGGYLERTRGAAYNFFATLAAPRPPVDDATPPRAFATVSSALLHVLRPRVDRAAPGTAAPVPPVSDPIAAAEVRPRETGIWIWIDGNESDPLPAHQEALARALGAQLALAGCSLCAFRARGVVSVVRQAFWQVLARLGFPSGQYRMIDPGTVEPELDGTDRSSLALNQIHRAAEICDAVLLVGTSARAGSPIRMASQRGKQVIQLADPAPAVAADQPAPPATWTPDATTRYAREIVAWLLDRLAAPVWMESESASLHAAAVALDERDLARYLERRALLRPAPAAALDPRAVSQLITDGRRPSHRLVGYEAAASSAHGAFVPLLSSALRAEWRSVELFGSTRTLHRALEILRDAFGTGLAEVDDAQARATAVVCSGLLQALRADPALERGESCRRLIEDMFGRSTAYGFKLERAEALRRYAAEYDAARRNEPSGPARTVRLDQLVAHVSELAASPGMPEAGSWFHDGTDGARIVGLALIAGAPEAAAFSLPYTAIHAPRSAFEQFTALRAAQAILPLLDGEQRGQLRKLLTSLTDTTNATNTCPRCGHANQPHYRFCLNCGTELKPALPWPPEHSSEQGDSRRALVQRLLQQLHQEDARAGRLPPGARVLVPSPNGLMQSALVRQSLQGFYELEVGHSGETIWVPVHNVVPEDIDVGTFVPEDRLGPAVGPDLPPPVAPGTSNAEVELRALRRRVAELYAALRGYRTGTFDPDTALQMEVLESDLSRLEIERDRSRTMLERTERQLALKAAGAEVRSSREIVAAIDEVHASLNDLLSSIRIEALAAEGELEQYAQVIPRASFELIRISLKDGVAYCDEARALVRRLRPDHEGDVDL